MLIDQSNINSVVFYLFGQYSSSNGSWKYKYIPSVIWCLSSIIMAYEIAQQYKQTPIGNYFFFISMYFHILFIFGINFHSRYKRLSTIIIFQQFSKRKATLITYIKKIFRHELPTNNFLRENQRKMLIFLSVALLRSVFNLTISTYVWTSKIDIILTIEMFYRDFSMLYAITLIDHNRYLLEIVLKLFNSTESDSSVCIIVLENKKLIKTLRHLKTIHFKVFDLSLILNDRFGWVTLLTSLDSLLEVLNSIYWRLVHGGESTSTYFSYLRKYSYLLN